MGDIFDSLDSMKKKGNYTLEEIEEAQKLRKKNGGSLMDNLIKLTGRELSLPSGMSGFHSSEDKQMETGSGKSVMTVKSPGEILLENQKVLNQEMENLRKNLKDDFGIEAQVDDSWKKDFGIATDASAKTGTSASGITLSTEEMLEQFAGLQEELTKNVFGQDEFIKKLIIAFKRPLVMPPEENKAMNSILVTGKQDTGKHFTLTELAKELKNRGVWKKSDLHVMDLGIYPEASMEKLFLQDIFAALSGDSSVILFEHFENCHPSFLTHISSLVIDGSFRLSERYVMQNGQLVSVSNSLATQTVGELHATGKYLVFVTEKSLDKVAGIMGAPFVNALGDICETAALDENAIRRIAEKEMENLKKNAAERFAFKLTFADDFLDISVTKSERQAGLKGVQDFYASVLGTLAQAKLEGDYPKDIELTIKVDQGKLVAQNGEEVIDLDAYLPDGYRGEIDEIKKEMDEIIGLAEVKEYIFGLEEYYKVQQRRAEEGLKTAELSKHMIFTGNPGTGKTTIARIVSKYLKAIGVLTGGQLVEVSRADLVGRYVGHTAPLTNKVIASAIGGVLFIDEAYSLYRGKDDSFGLEAIDTLVKGIEDNRDNLIVILAGYSNEMQEFLTSNSGLKSRFPNLIDFPDYTGEELLKISKSIAKSKGYTIDESADPTLTTYFNTIQMTRAKDAGNGRLARNKVEEAILNQSKRLVVEKDADLSVLLSQDFDLSDVEG